MAQSNASVIQQLAAGSYAVAPTAGMVDPIRAVDKGAPVALVRIVIQSPPYALLAKSTIKSLKDLKGKTIMIGGAKDITRIFTERMLELFKLVVERAKTSAAGDRFVEYGTS